MNNCLECNCFITSGVSSFSQKESGVSLCMEHQDWVRNMPPGITEAALRLYFALRTRGVPAQLEKWDGYKHIDIAIPEARVNIEVDGAHHNLEVKQALADLHRTFFSFLKGYVTLRIPNVLTSTDFHLEQTADCIVEFLHESLRQKSVRF